jgi:hypothetical protein
VDHRIPDAVGTGVADDALDHGFVVEYVQAGSPLLLAVALFGLTIALGRNARTS